MKKPELLAPAKNAETARAAILCGADAVYIGADEFGARSAAGNTVDDIAKLCDFAHIYGCKVYVALNTILSDAEVPRAARLAQKLYEANVDALIVQDLGLLEYGLPPIAIHSSTQCHTTTPKKAKFLEACGFDTIVVARELSLREISEISAALKPSTRLECFVHGALCVSYSGRCKLSFAIGGRSGNRGECAQPCRMKYRLLDACGNEIAPAAHYLSLRDMNRSRSLGELLDAGVDIFKIEGRLKDAGYVKNITALYRKLLDAELEKRRVEKPSYGYVETVFEPSAEKSFNRGFCEYHLHGTQGGCASFATPKARGEFLGAAERVFRSGFTLRGADKTLANGDGLAFEWDGGASGASVSKIDGDRVFVGTPNGRAEIPAGAKIYRNKNTAFENGLSREAVRKMPVEISAEERGGQIAFSIKTLDDRNARAEMILPEFERAKNPDAARASLAQNLSKLGNTPFSTDDVRISCAPFLRAAEINAIRRGLVSALEANILDAYNAKLRNRKPRPPQFYKAFSKPLDSDENIANGYAAKFHERFGASVSEFACEIERPDMRGKRVMTTKHCILRELGMCKKTSGKKLEEPLFLVNDSAELRLRFDCNRCGMEIFWSDPRRP